MLKKKIKKIYINIISFFFKFIYGTIKYQSKIKYNSRLKKTKIIINNTDNYLYEIFTGRLYTDTIQNTAYIQDGKIVNEASFQLNNRKNSKAKNNIVITRGTNRFLRRIDGNVLSLLTGGGGNNNYFHWLFDVLPRIKILETANKIKEIDYFLVPNLEEKFQLETLKELGLNVNRLLSSKKYRHIKSNKIFTTDHPWHKNNELKNNHENIPAWIIFWLRKKFLKKNNKAKKIKVYIDRSDSKSNVRSFRTIENEKEIKLFLKKKGFKIIKLTQLNFLDQVKLFYNAKIIVSNHGAGLSNIVFCNKKTKIIEFRTPRTFKTFENLGKKIQLNYKAIICNPKNNVLDSQFGRINVPINKLNKFLN